MISIYSILTLSTNLIVGMVNLLSLGQAAFFGIGAYLTAFALTNIGLSLFPAILFAVLVSGCFSFVIGFISLKLEGDYFILATLAFQIIIFSILYNWISVTKGPYGIAGIDSPKLFGIIEISGVIPFFVFSIISLIIVSFITYKLIHSPFGRVLRAIKDDEIGALTIGKNVFQFKLLAFVLSGAFCAISGFIYASYVTFIDPTSFDLDESIFILAAVIIGGTGNIKGPIIGALFVVLLPELIRFVGMPDSIASNMRMIIYGLSLILLMRYRKKGIAGIYNI